MEAAAAAAAEEVEAEAEAEAEEEEEAEGEEAANEQQQQLGKRMREAEPDAPPHKRARVTSMWYPVPASALVLQEPAISTFDDAWRHMVDLATLVCCYM